jgi:hypothetical protein
MSCHPYPAILPHFLPPHITTQGIGIQQHSYPSHSKHFVFPAAPLSGFTIDEMVDAADEPGPLRFTRAEEDEVHMLVGLAGFTREVWWDDWYIGYESGIG